MLWSNRQIIKSSNGGVLESLNGGTYRRVVEWLYMVESSDHQIVEWWCLNRRMVMPSNRPVVECLYGRIVE